MQSNLTYFLPIINAFIKGGIAMSMFCVSFFRNTELIWLLLVVFVFSCMPAVSLAQQPTATIPILIGIVLVNGQEIVGNDTVLNAGDVIETRAGAWVVLELSDGSRLELGENTKLDLAELSQTATGARVSRVKLLWGRIRAALSAGHQQTGSSFDIFTPNALIGVKFSQPNVEVSYDPARQETVALALTVALAVKNLITDEEKLVPIGSMAIITAVGIKIMAGAAIATGAIGTETAGTGAATTAAGTSTTSTASGIGTGTMLVIGAGAAAAVGGGVALATTLQEEANQNNVSFTGHFARSTDAGWLSTDESFTLTQQDASVTGIYSINALLPGGYCDPVSSTTAIAGTVSQGDLTFSLPFSRACAPCPIPPPPGWHTSWCVQIESGSYTARLDGDRALVFSAQPSCTALVNPDPAIFVICPGGSDGNFHGEYPRTQ